MKCEDIHEWLGIYWDLPERDLKRQTVDKHIMLCHECAEEFAMWQESTKLIRTAAHEEENGKLGKSISSSVMKRIYEEESWRMPVEERLYNFSYKLRRNLTAVIALFLAMFIFSFLFSIFYENNNEASGSHESLVFGQIGDPVIVAGNGSKSMNVHSMPTAVASLKGFNEPFLYQAGPFHSVKDHMLFISLIGLTFTLLIMNWLSRTRN